MSTCKWVCGKCGEVVESNDIIGVTSNGQLVYSVPGGWRVKDESNGIGGRRLNILCPMCDEISIIDRLFQKKDEDEG